MTTDPTISEQTVYPRQITWKSAGVLFLIALVGSLASLPGVLWLLSRLKSGEAFSPWIAGGSNVLVELILSAVAIGLGLWLGDQVGLGVRGLKRWLAREADAGNRLLQRLPCAVAVGLLLGIVLLVFLQVTKSMLPIPAHPVGWPPAWEMILMSLGAGIKEELWLRLGLMTLLAWLIAKVTRRTPTSGAVWSSILLAALIFGAFHLPQAAAMYGSLTLPLTILILAGNGMGGLVFGWLYWRWGLLAAMMSHFIADIGLHVIGPLVFGVLT